MTPFRLAWLNLSRRRLSTFVALVSIAISVASAGVLLRLYRLSGARFSTIAEGGDAVIGAKAGGLDILLGSLNAEGAYPDFIPLVLYQSLKSAQPVQFVDGNREVPNYLKSVIPLVYFGQFKKHRVIGTDRSFLDRPDGADKLSLRDGVWSAEKGQVVIGASAADREHVKVGDPLTINRWVGLADDSVTFTLKVSGILSSTGSVWDEELFASLSQARDVLAVPEVERRTPWKADVLHYYLAYVTPEGFGPLRELVNRRTVAQVIHVDEERAKLESLTGTGRRLGLLMTALILVLGGLGVAGMMITRFDGLSKSLAVLRALGFSMKEVTAWLVWEGTLLGVAAGIVGAGLDYLLFPLIRSSLGDALPTDVCEGIFNSAPVWLVALCATWLACLIPLRRLYSQDVRQSLQGL
jgi:putative ABC transport system permease protein